MNKIVLSSLVATALLFTACNSTEDKEGASNESTSKGVSFEKIADKLTATEFREYGVTSPTVVSTRLGDLHFTKGGFAGGYPTLKTAELLKAELDFQKAVQAYIWAVPLVSYHNWFEAHKKFGAKDGTIVQSKSAEAKQGILTGNGTTPYAIPLQTLKTQDQWFLKFHQELLLVLLMTCFKDKSVTLVFQGLNVVKVRSLSS